MLNTVQIKTLSPELQKIADDELGEVSSRIANDLETLKSWIEQQPHLKSRTDDQFLIQFLRGSKYSLEKAKERIDMFYTMKTKYPELFSLTDVENLRFSTLLKLKSGSYGMRQTLTVNGVSSNTFEVVIALTPNCLTILPKPLNDCGPRIFVFRFNHNCNEYKFEDLFCVFTALSEIALMEDPYSCICGIIVIIDFSRATARHYAQLSPGTLKKNFVFFTKTMPARIKGMYSIYSSAASQQVLKIAMPFIPEKVKQRICIFKDPLDLSQRIPFEYLPQDYGGNNGSLDNLALDMEKTIIEYRDYLKENSTYGTDESLRLGKPLDFESMFGMGGSFRKLEVD